MSASEDEGVAAVFGSLSRFHVYDHDVGEWVFSGVEFPDGRCIVEHKFDGSDDELTEMRSPQSLADADDSCVLVWEDGDSAEYDETYVDMEDANAAAQEVIGGVARQLGVDEERVRVAKLSAPNKVQYFLVPEPADIEEGADR